jgi:FtsP/CotA-like multicopper oxidase with cupredoxin domain
LHGHNFWILGTGKRVQRIKTQTVLSVPLALIEYIHHLKGKKVPFTSDQKSSLNTVDPPIRDVFTVPAEGWTIIRFVADNPGVWPFHCHIEWHLETGLLAQLIEVPSVIREQQVPYPQALRGFCK